MRRHVVPVIASLGLVLAAGLAPAQDEAQKELIKYRQNIMSAQGGHFGAMFQIVRGKAGSWDHFPAHAEALAGLAGMVAPAFRTPTEGGETRALPGIWEDFEGFESAARKLEEESAALVRAVESGDRAAIREQFRATLDACKGCHEDYREEED